MHQTHRPQRLMALLAVVGISAGGMLAMSPSAHADDSHSRLGRCQKDEGQTVVIDWRFTPDAGDSAPLSLARCIQLPLNATRYPLTGDPSPLTDPLESAGIPYEIHPTTKIVTSINGIQIPKGFTWQWSTAEMSADGPTGVWLGKSEWEPKAGINTIVGITLTDKPSDLTKGWPAETPEFEPGDYENKLPSEEPESSPSDTTSASVTPTVNPSPSVVQTPPQVATSTPKPSPSSTAKASTSTTSRTTTPRAQRTTRQPRQTYRPSRPTYRPQPPNNPQPPPVQAPLPPPPPFEEAPTIEAPSEPALPADPSGEGTGAANPPPTRVWGREDAIRQGEVAERSDKPAPWSQLAALAGAVVVVGGLGTAFARGLHTSQPPVVEEE